MFVLINKYIIIIIIIILLTEYKYRKCTTVIKKNPNCNFENAIKKKQVLNQNLPESQYPKQTNIPEKNQLSIICVLIKR